MKSSSEGKWLYTILALISTLLIIMSIITYSAILALPQSKSTINEERTLTTSGVGTITVTPDRVIITMGLDTQAPTAQEALRMNSEKMNRVIMTLKQLGIEEREMKTSYLSLQPQYIYPQNKEPILIGYKVINTITISTQSFEKIGVIIDQAVMSGVNRIDNIYFAVSDEKQKELKNEAIRRAIEDSKRKADNVAISLNIRIIGVKSIIISDIAYPLPPIVMKEIQTPTSVPTILPGESQITANVQVIYLIG